MPTDFIESDTHAEENVRLCHSPQVRTTVQLTTTYATHDTTMDSV
jgi:hypothetical protein